MQTNPLYKPPSHQLRAASPLSKSTSAHSPGEFIEARRINHLYMRGNSSANVQETDFYAHHPQGRLSAGLFPQTDHELATAIPIDADGSETTTKYSRLEGQHSGTGSGKDTNYARLEGQEVPPSKGRAVRGHGAVLAGSLPRQNHDHAVRNVNKVQSRRLTPPAPLYGKLSAAHGSPDRVETLHLTGSPPKTPLTSQVFTPSFDATATPTHGPPIRSFEEEGQLETGNESTSPFLQESIIRQTPDSIQIRRHTDSIVFDVPFEGDGVVSILSLQPGDTADNTVAGYLDVNGDGAEGEAQADSQPRRPSMTSSNV